MLWQLTALEALAEIRSGRVTSRALVEACLSRIKETDGDIGAWVHWDAETSLAQADAMDDLRRSGRPIGALHGVPVGLKDLFETRDMPTRWGLKQRVAPERRDDAAVVARLREAGAVILGKTVTTALAFSMDTPTRNPHDASRTRGGSSSGSAAAVAAGHVPLAVGTQTEGSTIRPASYCGVYGYKPTRGLISRRGCLTTSRSLDQVGVFSRTMEDAAALTDALTGFDPGDSATHVRPKPHILEGCRAEPPVPPTFAWFEMPYHDLVSPDVRTAFEEFLSMLGDRVERLKAPASFEDAVRYHRTIEEYEFALNFRGNAEMDEAEVDRSLRSTLERGAAISENDYRKALAMLSGAQDYFDAFFKDYDAIVTPAALSEAPPADRGTGDPICSTVWTFAGLPCLSLPWLSGENGLPVGVQLVGSREEDDRLLRSAAWLEGSLTEADARETTE